MKLLLRDSRSLPALAHCVSGARPSTMPCHTPTLSWGPRDSVRKRRRSVTQHALALTSTCGVPDVLGASERVQVSSTLAEGDPRQTSCWTRGDRNPIFDQPPKELRGALRARTQKRRTGAQNRSRIADSSRSILSAIHQCGSRKKKKHYTVRRFKNNQ